MQTSAGGSVTYGNPNLKAEHSNNYELGARYKGNMWLIDGAIYYPKPKTISPARLFRSTRMQQ